MINLTSCHNIEKAAPVSLQEQQLSERFINESSMSKDSKLDVKSSGACFFFMVHPFSLQRDSAKNNTFTPLVTKIMEIPICCLWKRL